MLLHRVCQTLTGLSLPALQFFKPFLHSFAGPGRHQDKFKGRVQLPCILNGGLHAEIDIGEQVGLVDDAKVRRLEHVGIFQRLVVAFSHTDHHHTLLFTQVEHGRTDQISDILDEKDTVILNFKLFHSLVHHAGIEVTTRTGVDLDGRGARFLDPFGVAGGLLITFNNEHFVSRNQLPDGLFENGCFSGTRRADQIEDQRIHGLKIATVPLCKPVVFGENIDVQRDLNAMTFIVMMRSMTMFMTMLVAVAVVGMFMGMFFFSVMMMVFVMVFMMMPVVTVNFDIVMVMVVVVVFMSVQMIVMMHFMTMPVAVAVRVAVAVVEMFMGMSFAIRGVPVMDPELIGVPAPACVAHRSSDLRLSGYRVNVVANITIMTETSMTPQPNQPPSKPP